MSDAPPDPSLFRDLADGTAGVAVRIVVAIAAGIFYAGAALAGSYLLAMAVPAWNRWQAFNPNYVGPRDELILVLALLAGAAWLATLAWLFLGRNRRRGLLGPALKTLIIAVVAIILGVALGSSLSGDVGFIIVGLIFLAIGPILLVWVQGIRAARRGRPLRNRADDLPDLRCPECGYRMVGLHESRCPECGRLYTLDELVARQNFARPLSGDGNPAIHTTPPPPPVSTRQIPATPGSRG
ncbi:MAG TPA: hypothetical protein VH475_04725 [Tepidisphaeraceae bacterium]|jgi:hypothetical protein